MRKNRAEWRINLRIQRADLLFSPVLFISWRQRPSRWCWSIVLAKFQVLQNNITSHKATDLGAVSGNHDVVWSEAGNTVLFSWNVNGLTNIWKYNLDNRSLTQGTFGAGPELTHARPGGKRNYYVNGNTPAS